MAERNIRITVEYDGTDYSGWQVQDDQKTVQGELIDSITKITGQTVTVTGAGRTDVGVHALGQVANFHIDHRLEANRFADAMNYYLPDDIRVIDSSEVPDEFNARRDAIYRRYRYLLSSRKSALYRYRRWETEEKIDFELIQQAAEMIKGEHDFAPFCVTASQKANNHCAIFHSHWYRWADLLIYEIRGNRFLHNMVRSLVGAMVNLSRRKHDQNRRNLTLADFADILQSGNRERNVFTAPPQGLYLVSVGYKEDQAK